jgi:hypothetical protein
MQWITSQRTETGASTIRRGGLAFTAFVSLLVCSASAYGVELTVECSNPRAKLKTITQALAFLPKQGPNTIHVSGACNENVIIDGFDNLTLVANPGASINDPTPSIPDDNDVVDILNSRRITVQGFTINGGLDGIACFQYSLCFLNNNTVQGANNTGVVIGRGTSADLTGNTIQGNAGDGLDALNGANAVVIGGTIRNNGEVGAFAIHQSLLRFLNDGSTTATIHENGSEGIFAQSNSTIFLANTAVSANGADGILVLDASVVRVGQNAQITGNGGNGVQLLESSFAFVAGSADLSGNGGSPLVCTGTFSNARAIGGNAGLSCHNP